MKIGVARGLLAFGHIATLFAFWVLVAILTIAMSGFEQPPDMEFDPFLALLPVLIPSVLVFGSGVALLASAARLHRESRGRFRLLLLASSSIIFPLFILGLSTEFASILRQGEFHPSYLALSFEDLEFFLEDRAIALLITIGIAGIVFAALSLGSIIATWFLMPRWLRLILWIILDVAIAVAFVIATLLLPISPPDDAPLLVPAAAVRLTITVLFAVRALVWIVPPILEQVGDVGFLAKIATRHLRAKKSGFLTTMGVLSVGAVAFSACALSTSLSVMGGFRHDLRDKILGHTAHLVVDREGGRMEGWAATLDQVRATPGVVGATPILQGEVMVSSASNIGGALLRGIDPASIGQVSVIEENMDYGGLEYLLDPEMLLEVPLEERGSITATMPLPEPRPHDESSELTREIDQAIDEAIRNRELLPPEPLLDEPDEGALDGTDEFDGNGIDEFLRDPEPLRRILPGIIVGRELARSLRLYVGDEVNVVSPFGDLGPSGPMPKSRAFRVAGIFYSGMYEYDMKHAYVTLETAQEFLNTGDAISAIEARLEPMDDAPVIASALREDIAPDLRVRDWQVLNNSLFGALNLERLLMFILLGLALLVAGFCIACTMTLMVQEKTKEVGVLLSLGATTRSIMGIFTLEGLLIGVCGGILGLALGYVQCFVSEWGLVRIDPEVFYIDRVPVHIDPMEFAIVGIVSAAISLVMVLIPAYSATLTKPVDALRFD